MHTRPTASTLRTATELWTSVIVARYRLSIRSGRCATCDTYFRLDDEDSVNRHENVVDLGGSALAWEHEVVDSAVNVCVEPHPHAELGRLFTDPAFDDRKHGGD